MSPLDIVRRRLSTQRLIGHSFSSPTDAVAFFGAVQGQDYLYSLWALGLRVAGATEATIEAAIAGRQIVRAWPFRGTVHHVTAADVRWMVSLTAERTLHGATRRLRQLELDDDTLARSRRAIAKTLQGHGPVARPEILKALEAAGVSPAGQRGYHILWYHANEGLIVIGPRVGKQQSFVLLDEWLPPTKELAREEALAELARRYFTSHGPAQIKDYIWWSSLPAAEARAGLEAIKPQLAQEAIGGAVYWYDPSQPAGDVPSPIAHLLPFVDEYLIAYRDRDALQDPAFNALVDSGNVSFHAPFLIDGRVAGIWKRALKKEWVIIEATPLRPISDAERDALVEAADRFGAFLGLAAEIAWSELQ
jgi:hypothetical protein